jgi:hypothetical protein
MLSMASGVKGDFSGELRQKGARHTDNPIGTF